MNRAVWSYWSKPMAAGTGGRWLEPKHHLLSWALSVETARRHFRHTALVTDAAGAALLVDQLGLAFTEVSTELDALADADPDWWALGKLVAYQAQPEPFIHIDSDAYLWGPLPERLTTAPVLAQNIETFRQAASYYQPEVFESALAVRGWLPPEWIQATRLHGELLAAVCCGILGGTNVEFLAHYARRAIDLVSHPENQLALGRLEDRAAHVILIEQFLLWACLEYHRESPSSRFRDVRIEYLFASQEQAYQGMAVSPYTHLIGAAKRNRLIMDRLEKRVGRQYPKLAARIVNMT
ncbi:MAG: DUF6734 family protein [Streptosporangiaceae bacterium]